MSRRRRLRLWTLTALIVVGASLALAELLIYLASPAEYLYPRYQFSAQYGLIPFANVRMVHGVPRRYQFHYTVNSMQSRGNVVAPGASGLPAVVVLGDSYAFGMGVDDGEEFPSVMGRALAGRADVVNLGSPGWGLTQEIRRYHDTGAAYDPRIVVLQFCGNDPDDNLINRVTRVEGGEFVFVDSGNSLNLTKKFLSRSFLQRTQLYNFFRARASTLAQAVIVRRQASRLDAAAPDSARAGGGVPAAERVYAELLEALAAHLHAEGRALWIISVDRQLKEYPRVDATVKALAAQGNLRYVEVLDWLRGHEPYHSAEGHVWGSVAHRVIGERLAAEVAAALGDSSAAARP
jgi:hypothetical protein